MKRFLPLLLVAAFIPLPAHATRTVTSPYVDEGTLKLKSKTGITHDDEREARDGAVSQIVGAEYGITERFSLEAEAQLDNAGDDNNTDATLWSAKAKVQFTEKNQYWLDAGARLSYKGSLNDVPDNAELKFILAKDTENFRHIANFIFDMDVGDTVSHKMNGGLSWSSRYKWKSYFEPGFEMYNNLGPLSDFNWRLNFEEEDHSIGPVAYGKLGPVKYEAGYLAGLSDNAADGRFKLILEYGVKF